MSSIHDFVVFYNQYGFAIRADATSERAITYLFAGWLQDVVGESPTSGTVCAVGLKIRLLMGYDTSPIPMEPDPFRMEQKAPMPMHPQAPP